MILGNFIKQPVDVLDYDIDYSEWITPDDSISAVEFDIDQDGELLVNSSSINSPRVKVFLSGGTNGVTYKITVTITTLAGRIKQIEFKVRVRDT